MLRKCSRISEWEEALGHLLLWFSTRDNCVPQGTFGLRLETLLAITIWGMLLASSGVVEARDAAQPPTIPGSEPPNKEWCSPHIKVEKS